MYLDVTPAYARDYKSAKAAKEDWLADKDFIEATSGQYINRRQVADSVSGKVPLKDAFGNPIKGHVVINVRYKRLTMIGKLEEFKG